MEQIERVRRYLERTRQIYAGVPDRDDARLYYRDDVETFFVHCHHILDWAEHLNRAGVTRDDLQTYVNAHEELRICADLCTGAKHCRVRNLRTSRQPHVSSIRRTAYPLEDGQMVTAMDFGITANGQLVDALELAEACMDLWDEFTANPEQLVDPADDDL